MITLLRMGILTQRNRAQQQVLKANTMLVHANVPFVYTLYIHVYRVVCLIFVSTIMLDGFAEWPKTAKEIVSADTSTMS